MRYWNLTGWLVIGLCWCAGCEPKARISDESERDHPAMIKALEQEKAGDLEGARFTYQALLDRNPTIARAHLALAFLQDKAGDPVEALYHYRRYLALRPDTEKRKMIEDHIRAAQMAYVGTVFTNEASILRKLSEVERENSASRVRISNLEAQNAQLRAALANLRARYAASVDEASRALDHVGLPVPAPRTAGKVVRVNKGDSLRKIAVRVYGDQDRWREIYEANRGQLRKPEDVRVGQLLIIPEKDRE